MHRPANMGRPPVVVDQPLAEMGKDEILPIPITDAFSDAGTLNVAAGIFAVKTGRVDDKFIVWVNSEVPVIGVVRVGGGKMVPPEPVEKLKPCETGPWLWPQISWTRQKYSRPGSRFSDSVTLLGLFAPPLEIRAPRGKVGSVS